MSANPAIEEVERGMRVVLEGLKRLRSADEWVDQDHSPLKKRAHLDAVRRGDLQGRKVGSQVFVRRAELDEYIEKHRVIVKCEPTDAEEEERLIEQAMKYEGRRRRAV